MLSIHDPVFAGIDEFGQPVKLGMPERSVILGGEPGSGKSTALQLLIAHSALSHDVESLILLDGKQVELGMWQDAATEFVGPDPVAAIAALAKVQAQIDATLALLAAQHRRKVDTGYTVVACDELALFTSVFGDKKQQAEFSTRLRDIVARGRAAGIIPLLATQRPSSDIVPTSLRDLCGYRWAFRCSTDEASDTILGSGWHTKGYSAAEISPSIETRGQALLRAEDGVPRLMRAALLSDTQIHKIAAHAAAQRRQLAAA